MPLRPGERLLPRDAARRSVLTLRVRLRRLLAGAGVVVAAAAVVAGLGLLAGATTPQRAADPVGTESTGTDTTGTAVGTRTSTVTVGGEATVWEVARAVAPGASGPELAAVAERIVTANSLSSVRLHPGQVLTVTTG